MAGGRFRSYLRAHLPRRSAARNGNTPAPPDADDSPFDYALVPLPSAATHFRVLDLLPPPEGTDPDTPSDAPLQCRLFTYPLDKLPTYLALSYTWGSGAATHPLRVVTERDDGVAWSAVPLEPGEVDPGAGAPLGITESLAEALRHLRSMAPGAFLWVDQICIDQGNVAEKNAQVAAMGDIYAGALMVYVWLGPARDGLDLFADRMSAVYDVARDEGFEDAIAGDNPQVKEHLDGWDLPDPRPEHKASKEVFSGKVVGALFGEGYSDDEVMAVARARRAWLTHPWFSRVWVIQEFALSRRAVFLCGMTGIDAGCFAVAHIVLAAANTTIMDTMTRAGVDLRKDAGGFGRHDYAFDSLIRIRKEWNEDDDESQGIPLLVVIKRLYGETRPPLFATDSRDRIFALLGLASDVDRLGIRVDYSEGTPADVLYTRATRAMIESTTSGLSILEMVRFPKSVSNDEAAAARLPSWVPDFDNFGDPIAAPGEWVYSPTGDVREPCFLPTPDERILGLKGILVDHVLLVGDAWDNDSLRPKNYDDYCLDIQRLLASDSPICPAGGQPDDGDTNDDDDNNDDHLSTDGSNHNNHDTNTNTATTATEDHLTTAIRIMTGDLDTYANARRHPLGPAELSAMRSLLELHSLLAGPVPPRGTPAGDQHRAREQELLDAPTTMQLAWRLLLMAGRRPYRTRDGGHVGMGPGGTRPGDVVVIFPGARTPYVLRPSGERGAGYYELVGETYCHGVMHGERWGGELEEFFLV